MAVACSIMRVTPQSGKDRENVPMSSSQPFSIPVPSGLPAVYRRARPPSSAPMLSTTVAVARHDAAVEPLHRLQCRYQRLPQHPKGNAGLPRRATPRSCPPTRPPGSRRQRARASSLLNGPAGVPSSSMLPLSTPRTCAPTASSGRCAPSRRRRRNHPDVLLRTDTHTGGHGPASSWRSL